MKKTKLSTYIAAGFTITLALLLGLFLVMIINDYMTPRKIRLIIVTEDATRSYDGTPLTCEKYHIQDGELDKGDELSLTFHAEQTKVGEKDNTATVKVLDRRGLDVSDKYEIEIKCGTLEVTPRTLYVSTPSAEKMYDGYELTMESYEIKTSSLVSGDELVPKFDKGIERVGTKENSMEAVIFDRDGEDVSDQYQIVYDFGTLSVTKRTMTIKTGSIERAYDGFALEFENYSILDGSAAPFQTLRLEFLGKQTIVGQSLNTVRPWIYDSEGNDVSNQYEFEIIPGDLIVTPRKIVIRSADAEKTYDGAPLSSSNWSFLEGDLCYGETISVQTHGSQTSVGACENQVVNVAIFNAANVGAITFKVWKKRGDFTQRSFRG